MEEEEEREEREERRGVSRAGMLAAAQKFEF